MKQHARRLIFGLFLLVPVHAMAQHEHDARPVAPAAEPLPLSAVRLTGGPLLDAQRADAEYLLSLDIDRMVAGYRLRAGLEPKAEPYTGWDSTQGKQLTGHIAGHYLSAVSLMYAATGDERFKQRADQLVDELKQVQNARGNGYLGAVTDNDGVDGIELMQHVSHGDIRSGGFDLNGLWAPWYVYHKTFAGLRDAYRYTGNRTALDVEVKFAQWAASIVEPMSDEQVGRMLRCEFGGMNEVLADLYADTGDTRWLALSHRFDLDGVYQPIAEGQDVLPGKHGNTQVPKFVGTAARYLYAGDRDDAAASAFFWDRVVHHHSFATGGHGKDEYFGPPDQLSRRLDGRTAETCNVYNMLKLTRMLFALTPDAEYAAFQERAMFNHILGAIDPQTGQTTYMAPVGQGVGREYADMYSHFTCCVGSGMESHALHGDGIYYSAGEDTLWVTIFAPSVARWDKAGATVTMDTDFPLGESATLSVKLDSGPKRLTLMLRRPAWAGHGFAVSVNGESTELLPEPGAFFEVTRTWSDGDRVELTMPKHLHLEPTPDDPDTAALMWGPLVLVGDLGTERRRRGGGDEQLPVLVVNNRDVQSWLGPAGDAPGRFITEGVGEPTEVTLVPFYLLHHRRYTAYWKLYSPERWQREAETLAAEQERLRQLQAVTIDFSRLGEQQPEQDHNLRSDGSRPVRTGQQPGRRAGGWFELDLEVEPDKPNALIVTYYNGSEDNWGGAPSRFNILIDGQLLQRCELEDVAEGGAFYEQRYAVPAEVIAGKGKVTVRFEAFDGGQAGPAYGVRMIRDIPPGE